MRAIAHGPDKGSFALPDSDKGSEEMCRGEAKNCAFERRTDALNTETTR